MSMAIIAVGTFAVGTAYQITEGRKARDLQERMQTEAEARANDNAKNQDIAMNKVNQKRPDIVASRNANLLDETTGSTMLTGAGGVDKPLPLGQKTLLGS